MSYICKIATVEEVSKMFDLKIEHADDKIEMENQKKWKQDAINDIKTNSRIVYHGILDGKAICEATAAIEKEKFQNSNGLIDDETAYLLAFRTDDEYQGQGYFSKLFNFMIDDLKKRGYKKVTVGVEPEETKNKNIYNHYGFTKHIKTEYDYFPDGTTILVEYYSKDL